MGMRGVAVGLAVVGVLAAGGVVADEVARTSAEQRLATALEARIEGLDGTPDVVIDGFPFVTQLLTGELHDVRLGATSTIGGVRLERIDVHLTGVSIGDPAVAEHVRLTALVPLSAIRALLPMDVDLAVDGGLVVGSTEVLGLPLDIVLRPVAAGRAVRVGVEELRLAGAVIDADHLPGPIAAQLDGLTFPVDALPDGLELTRLAVVQAGITLVAEGTAVVLTP